ncbi:MAG: AraC family transcriptional regulator [Victivallaceae bacterium]
MLKTDIIKHLFVKVSAEYHLKIHSCYNVKVPPSWKIEKRYIKDYHLLFVRGGHGCYYIDGHEIKLKRGQIVFVGGGAYYEGMQDISHSLSIIPIRFGFYNNNSGSQLEPISDSISYSYNSINTNELEFLFLEIIRLYNLSQSIFIDSNISSLLHTLLCRTLYEAEKDTVHKPENGLDEVHEWLKMHPLDRSDIGKLAKKYGISRKYFTTLFKRNYGLSPKSYQVSLRMNYAKYLLQESAMPIKEIATQLGYTDQYIFSKQFKSIIGHAPSAIRN